MSLHPALSGYSNLRHVIQFSKALEVLDSQLRELGVTDWQVSIDVFSKERGALRRFFEGVDPKTIHQSMTVLTDFGGITAQIDVCMINSGWLLPLEIYFELPVPSSHHLECYRAVFGRKWTSKPINTDLCNRVDAVLPKVRVTHLWIALHAKLDLLYEITPTEDATTLFTVRTGFKRGMFNRPKFELSRYFVIVPALIEVLRA